MAMAPMSARPCSRPISLRRRVARVVVGDGKGAEDLSLGGAQGCHRHPAQAHPAGDLLVVVGVRDARIDQVVVGPDWLALPPPPSRSFRRRWGTPARPATRASTSSTPPATTAGGRIGASASRRVRCAASDPRRRFAPSTTCWSTSSGSRMAVMRAVIFCRVCCVSTWRASSVACWQVGDRRRRVIAERAQQVDLCLAEGGRTAGVGAHRPDHVARRRSAA